VLLGINLYPNDEEKWDTKSVSTPSKNRKTEKDFKPLNTYRLSEQMELQRQSKEENHV
jgi:hypothetical protein